MILNDDLKLKKNENLKQIFVKISPKYPESGRIRAEFWRFSISEAPQFAIQAQSLKRIFKSL